MKTLSDYEKEWKEQRPDVVYHYTSIDACSLILGSKTFRATNIEFLNDNKELGEAYNLIKKVFSEQLNCKDFEKKNEIIKKVLKNVEMTMKAIEFPIYTISFTEEDAQKYKQRGSLEQWRGYGDNGAGCRIGFKTKNIEHYFLPKYKEENISKECSPYNSPCKLLPVKVHFCKCIYKEEDKKEFIRVLINDIFSDGEKQYIPTIAENLFTRFATYAPILKDEAYEYEKEWRLVFTGIPWCLAEMNSVKPFCSIAVCLQAVFADILLGPRANKEFATTKINFQLRRNGIISVCDAKEIEQSNIPYRG